MWRWLLIQISVFLTLTPNFCSASQQAASKPIHSSSVGPTSDEEAKILWMEGTHAFQHQKMKEASYLLQRYVDRYPGYPHFIEAHLFLGQAYFELEKYEDAIRHLKGFIAAHPSSLGKKVIEAKLRLGKTYVAAHKYEEALILSTELDRLPRKASLSATELYESLLNKSNALLGLKHPDRATLVLDSIWDSIEGKADPSSSKNLSTQANLLRLKLKNINCSRLPSSGPLDESQLRNQLERRGLCLLEALLNYRKILQNDDPKASIIATELIENGFDEYARVCAAPAPISHLVKGQRTQTEIRNYQNELRDLLTEDCKTKRKEALDLLNSWKGSLSQEASYSLAQAAEHLEKFLSRKP